MHARIVSSSRIRRAQGRLPANDDWRSRNARLETEMSPEYVAALESLMSSDPAQRFSYGLDTFIEGITPTR